MSSSPRATLQPTGALDEFQGELGALYESWGILDLLGETAAALPPEWLRILNIARNLLDNRQVPGVPMEESLADFLARPEEERPAVRHRPVRPRYAPPISSDVVLRPMQSLSDFPDIDPSDLALGFATPEIFEFRLASGDVNAYYMRDLRPAEQLPEEETDDSAPERRSKRQKVYVLLDVSNSMRDHNKMVFAKALVLAYLIRAAEEGAELYFRTFANSTHARSESTDRAAFAAMATRVLRISPDGGTDIRMAINTAIGDIRSIDGMGSLDKLSARAPTEILLISDCESYSVPFIPPTVKLHTVHLKDGPVAKSAAEGFESIKEGSATYHEIDATALWLQDTTLDRWLLKEEMRLDPGSNSRPGAAKGKNGEKPQPSRSQALMQVYDRMERGGRKGNRATQTARGVSAIGRSAVVNPWHAFLAILRALHLRRHAKPLAWQAVAHSRHRRGAEFRIRR